MSKNPSLPYSIAHDLIEEADVLLFRSKCWYSRFIKSYTNSPYTHVALASKHNGLIEIIEFHGWTGGGAGRNLAQIVKQQPGQIDVYRPSSVWNLLTFNDFNLRTSDMTYFFSSKVARKITNTMRKMTGLPYGWKRIWWMAKRKLVGLRLFYKPEDLMDDELKDVIYPVCSTALSYAFSKHGFDIIKNKSDEWTEPGHVSLSSNLNKLFTIDWDDEKDRHFLT